jgi:hypothetical protein
MTITPTTPATLHVKARLNETTKAAERIGPKMKSRRLIFGALLLVLLIACSTRRSSRRCCRPSSATSAASNTSRGW